MKQSKKLDNINANARLIIVRPSSYYYLEEEEECLSRYYAVLLGRLWMGRVEKFEPMHRSEKEDEEGGKK